MNVLLVDNYDSFTHNLAQRLGELGATVQVHRNDAITVAEIRRAAPDCIVLSPGPGHPARDRDFGVCRGVLEQLAGAIPILGVCLGHQGIVHHFGGRLRRADAIVHGKSSPLAHDDRGLFEGLPQGAQAMRYHSIIADADTIPACLRVTARVGDIVMAVEHRELPVWGLQFHPESIGTPDGQLILGNYLRLARSGAAN